MKLKSLETILKKKEISELLSALYQELNFEVSSATVAKACKRGQGYLSDIASVHLEDVQNRQLNLIVKCAPEGPTLRKMVPLHELYKREMFFYDKLMPSFVKFQREHGLTDPFINVPKCYKTMDTSLMETLVLDNIKENGFVLWNGKETMNDDHVKLVLKTYGKLHAISYAMKILKPDWYHQLYKDLPDIITSKTANMKILNYHKILLEKTAEKFAPKQNTEIIKKLDEFKRKIINFYDFYSENKGDYPVILHGDCWVNNIMFKYDSQNLREIPSDICLLDFQHVRWGSPVLDLSYFFYVSTSGEMLEDIYEYLKIYHESLSHSLSEFKCSNKIFPYEALRNEWKEHSKFGFFMTVGALKGMFLEDDEVTDLNEAFESGCDTTKLDKTLKNDGLFFERLMMVIRHMYKFDLF